tara:strand:- start:970 stop:2523 length:1554 start_codon:yes stop_codon:yes gene_type:complete
MAQPTWKLYLRDIVTTGTYTEVSTYLENGAWSLGFGAPYEPMARESILSVTLNNADRRFSPEYSSGTYYGKLKPGILIKLTSTDPADSTVRTMFIGWVDAIKPTPGVSPDKCVITAQGFNARAALSEVSIPVQEDVTYDAVLDTILENSRIYPPGTSAWFLGVVGQSELGSTTELGSTSTFANFETGISTFLFAGDWGDNTTVYGAMQQTVGREYGRLWSARDGILNAINRHKLITDKTVDYAITTFSDMDYQYGSSTDIANLVNVRAATRRETATQVVAGLQNPVAISAGGTVDITYVIEGQSSGDRIAVKSPITPAATTDFLCNASADGTGTNLTSSCTGAIVSDKSFATRVTVRYSLSGSTNGYITFGQLRGTKLDQFAVVEQSAQDDDSIRDYGRRQLTWAYNMDSVDTADTIAGHILRERKDPRGRVKNISFKPTSTAALLTQALTRSIFDRVTVTDTQTGLDAVPYFIIAETHAFENQDYSVVWDLEPSSATDYWVLGTNTLGETTTLGPL